MISSGAKYGVSLLAVSVLVTCLAASVTQWSAPGGSLHFVALADWITGAPLGSPQPIEVRDLGYPLMIVLLGKNPFAVIVAQFVMAALLPLLVYWQIAPFDRRVAWAGGGLVMVSLAPYQFAGWLHHDQLFIFTFVLSCALTLWTFEAPSHSRLCLTAASWFIASISRPAANLSGLLCLTLLALLVREHRRAIVASALVLLVAVVGYSRWRAAEIVKHGGSDYSGAQLFFTAYVLGGQAGVHFHASDGLPVQEIAADVSAASERLVAREPRMLSWLSAYSFDPQGERLSFPPEVFHAGASGATMTEFIFGHPTNDFNEFIAWAVSGNAPLLGRAAWVSFRRHPFAFLQLGVRRSALLLWKPGFAAARFVDPRGPQLERQRLSFYFLERNTGYPQLFLMPASYQRAFAPSPPSGLRTSVENAVRLLDLRRWWAILDEGLTKAVLMLFAAGFAVAVWTRKTTLTRAMLLAALPQFAVVCVTGLVVGADYRYHFMAFPEAVALGALGLCAFASRLVSTSSSHAVN